MHILHSMPTCLPKKCAQKTNACSAGYRNIILNGFCTSLLSLGSIEICPHKHTHENWRNTRDWENTSPLLTCPTLILLKSLSSFTTNFCVFAKLLKWPPIHVASQPTHFSRRWSIFFPTHHNVFLFFFVSFFYACAIYPDNLWRPQKEHYYTQKQLHVLTLNSGHWYKSFIYIFSTEKKQKNYCWMHV